MTSGWEILLRVVLAVVFGGVIGFGRRVRNKPAGAANADAVRVAAGVITGVGFLGAGAILRTPAGVRGLTTAAGIWVTAAIGIALGFGYYGVAAESTVLAMIAISLLADLDSPDHHDAPPSPKV